SSDLTIDNITIDPYNLVMNRTDSASSKINFWDANGTLEIYDNGGANRNFSLDQNANATIGTSLTIASQTKTANLTPLATLDVRATSGTLPVASLSGQTSFASAIIDQSGLGDIFTASKSGSTKFVINNS